MMTPIFLKGHLKTALSLRHLMEVHNNMSQAPMKMDFTQYLPDNDENDSHAPGQNLDDIYRSSQEEVKKPERSHSRKQVAMKSVSNNFKADIPSAHSSDTLTDAIPRRRFKLDIPENFDKKRVNIAFKTASRGNSGSNTPDRRVSESEQRYERGFFEKFLIFKENS